MLFRELLKVRAEIKLHSREHLYGQIYRNFALVGLYLEKENMWARFEK